MEETRTTRWQLARQEWAGFRRRDLVVGLAGIVLAIAGLVVFGRPGGAVTEVLIVGGAAILAAILYPLGQLVWAWLQAPMRLLTDEVIAIRERLEMTPLSPRSSLEPPFDMRYSLLNSIRLADHLRQQRMMTRKEWEAWATPVIAMLTEHADRADAERFLEQRSLVDQVSVLQQMLEKASP